MHEAVLDEVMSKELHCRLEKLGWAHVKNVDPELAGEVAKQLASRLSGSRANIAYTEVRVYSAKSAPTGSMSSIVGTGPQPMHTDGAHHPDPPRYLIFYCSDAGNGDRRTRIWTIDAIAANLSRHSNLKQVSWLSRPGLSGAFYCPVLDEPGGVIRVRYDPICMKQMSGCDITHHDIERQILSMSVETEVRWATGDILVVDNWRCLHARAGALLPSQEDPRTLQRWSIGGTGNGLVAR